jgi:hypothetical protein
MLTYMLDTNICIYVMKNYPLPATCASTRCDSMLRMMTCPSRR